MKEVFEHGGWRFEADNRPLSGAEEVDKLGETFTCGTLPDMYFGGSVLRIQHLASSTTVELSAFDALQCLAWRPPPPASLQPSHADCGTDPDGPVLGAVQCQFAKKWRPDTANPDVHKVEVTSDWTCMTPYWGSFFGAGAPGQGRQFLGESEGFVDETGDELPMDLLRRRDEILWYQEVQLWEDELADNGLCKVIARVRVMPSFWFVLLSCEQRVDNVLLRDVSTRLFCANDSDSILREWTWRQASAEVLKDRGVDFSDHRQMSGEIVGTQLLQECDVKLQIRHRIRWAKDPNAESQDKGVEAGADK